MANFESLQLLTGRKKDSIDSLGGGGGGVEEKEVLASLDEASPLATRRLARSKSLSEKSNDGSPAKSRKGPTPISTNDQDDQNLSGWVLVNAVTVSLLRTITSNRADVVTI
jgi:hypothetical protein